MHIHCPKLMEAKLPELPKMLGGEVTLNSTNPHARRFSSMVAVAKLPTSTIGERSLDFSAVPLISRPVWIDNNQIAIEDSSGNITILDFGMQPLRVGTLSVPRNLHYDRYGEMALSVEPSIRYFSSPSSGSPPESRRSTTPLRHMLGFSPGSRQVGVCGGNHAFVWSTDSCQLIAQYLVPDITTWVLSSSVMFPSYLVPNPIVAPCIPDLHQTQAITLMSPG
ncbi:uncharacterized protein EI90DRAFT_1256673 [Cantharellus anzutake]|uniref:uncharacterized protein n=1 Tax=Cantharellus anzutake TaxID=1750568 RepID=UPI0019043FDD|nr:uncharacterized protein EI90DRAFT_1256673 [Cantharellus anzutake]KAF8329999.1 hypothetical protein EI90DRAFT_1256673 [Cantharellus anzutake]